MNHAVFSTGDGSRRMILLQLHNVTSLGLFVLAVNGLCTRLSVDDADVRICGVCKEYYCPFHAFRYICSTVLKEMTQRMSCSKVGTISLIASQCYGVALKSVG